MNVDECYLLGYVIKRHGLKGEVTIKFDVDHPLLYSELESVFVEIGQKLIPFFIDHLTIKGDKAVVRFEQVNTAVQADELKGHQLYLPLTSLPPLDGKAFYYHEVIGFQVHDTKGTLLGKVTSVYSAGGQDILAVENVDEKEILIPISDDILMELDRAQRMIKVELPEGLLDIYLE